MTFVKEFNKEREAAIASTQEAVKVTAITLFNDVVVSSPVGNTSLWKTKYPPANYVGGQFRSNWFVSTESPSTKTTTSTSQAQVRQQEIAQITTSPYSSSYLLTNNLPYAQRIENGWSSQAPAGVVAPAVSRVQPKIPKFQAAADKKFGVS